MAIEKSLAQAPQGLEELAMGQPDLSIEIENPDSVTLDDGSMEITIEPGKESNDEFNANLAEELDEGQLTQLSGDLIGEYDADIASRKDWLTTYVEGLELLGLKVEDRTEPWPGACNVFHPLMTEALVKFQAETMMETFPAAGPVKTQIVGKITKEKEQAAQRVQEDMNFQLTDKMPEYRPEHERMLWGLGLAGNAFKKVYYDPNLERQVSMYVTAEDIVVPYGASSLEMAERVTHMMRKTPNEIRKLQVAGFYRDVDLGEPFLDVDEAEKKIAEKMGFNPSEDDRYKILEMHVTIDLENGDSEDGIALPYVVTIEKGTGTILAIRRNWDPEDKLKSKRQHFVHYGYIPGFGFYCFGLIHLIGAFAKSGTMILRQLVDAGTLSNLPGGMKSRGLRIKGDDTPIAPGEWRDVDVPSGAIRDNILPLPYKEPSQTLAALMDKIVEEGRAFANADGLKVSDMSANAPVGTTLAILERTLKVMSAVQARIYYAMKQEFKLLKGIIRDYTPEEYSYDPDIGDRRAKQADYDNVDVIPVSDPNAATMSQKVVQYQAVMQLAQGNPDIYDMKELNKQMLEVLGVKNIGKLIPSDDDQKPKDPVSENMAIITGEPVKAFIYQDHEAHITVHMAFKDNPKLAQLAGQSPNAGNIQAAMEAHIAEHLAFAYRRQIEEQLGVPLPTPDETLPEDVELELSRLVAQAAQKLNAKDSAEIQQQQNEAQQQDPLIQMQQQELQIKQQESQAKAQKMLADHQLEQQRLEGTQSIEQQKLELEKAKLELEKAKMETQERISGAELGFKAVMDNKKIDAEEDKAKAQQMAEGLRFGAEQVQREKDREHSHKQTDLLHMEKINQMMLQKRQHESTLEHQKEQANKQKESKKPKE
jgi:hypothetical protein